MKKEVLNELERIRQENGGLLQPQVVVNEAQNPESPLHPYFDWDDSEAACKWRLEQARRLIRVAVTIIHPDQTEPIRTYVSLLDDRMTRAGYRSTVEVLNDKERRDAMLQQALRELAAFRKKYAVLSELAEVFAAADAVLAGQKEQSA